MEDIKLKSFQSQMNPHFVFNTLNAIQYYISTNEKTNALKYISVLGKLFRYHLNNLEADFVLLDSEIEMIHWYIKLQNLRYDNRFDLQISSNYNSKEKEPHLPSFILQTIFENLIETSVTFNHSQYFLKTHFEVYIKQIVIEIELTALKSNRNQTIYNPEYRQELLKWEDQIDALVRTKKYSIQKKIKIHNDKNNNFIGCKINLVLPNLP